MDCRPMEASHVAVMPCKSNWPLAVKPRVLAAPRRFELIERLNMGAEGPRSRMLLAEPRHVKGVVDEPSPHPSARHGGGIVLARALHTHIAISNRTVPGTIFGRRAFSRFRGFERHIGPAPFIVEQDGLPSLKADGADLGLVAPEAPKIAPTQASPASGVQLVREQGHWRRRR